MSNNKSKSCELIDAASGHFQVLDFINIYIDTGSNNLWETVDYENNGRYSHI